MNDNRYCPNCKKDLAEEDSIIIDESQSYYARWVPKDGADAYNDEGVTVTWGDPTGSDWLIRCAGCMTELNLEIKN